MYPRENLFESRIDEIIDILHKQYGELIKKDMHDYPNRFDTVMSWLEYHPETIGTIFTSYLVDYGYDVNSI